MVSSGERLARSALVRTTKVLALETTCDCAASWVARRGGGYNFGILESRCYSKVNDTCL